MCMERIKLCWPPKKTQGNYGVNASAIKINIKCYVAVANSVTVCSLSEFNECVQIGSLRYLMD